MKQELLHVSAETIKKYSVVSSNVTKEMAISALKKTTSDYAIAVTGNAGPTSDDTSMTVGIVFIAIASAKGVVVEKFNFGHPREKVINRTVNKSLQMLQQEILKK
jgi:nicotinamide-nucleotide amidase